MAVQPELNVPLLAGQLEPEVPLVDQQPEQVPVDQPEQEVGDQAPDEPEQEAGDPAANQPEIEEADPAANQPEIEEADPAANQPEIEAANPIHHLVMSEVFNNKPIPPVIYNFAGAFQHVVDRGDIAVALNKSLDYNTVFDSSSYRGISMEKYLIYIHNVLECSPSCYIQAYSYLDRLANLNLQPPITSRNAHRILLTAVGLGIRALDGERHSNRYFASVGQLSLVEVNEMVQALLFALDYKVHVPEEEFMSHKAFLERYDDEDDEERNCCCCFSMFPCFH